MITESMARRRLCKRCPIMDECKFIDHGEFATCGSFINLLSDDVNQTPNLSPNHVPKIDISRISEVLKSVGGGLLTIGHYFMEDTNRIVYFILGAVILYGLITAWLSGGII